MIILLVTVYAIGSEIKFRTGDEWLEAARMNMFVAVVGKLLPYTIIFCIMSVFANYYHVRGHAYSFRLRFLAIELDGDLVRGRYASVGGIPVLVVSRYSDRD